MVRKLYEYCNTVDARADTYEVLPLDQEEQERLKQRVMGNEIRQARPAWQRGLAVAAVMMLLIGAGHVTGTAQRVYATVETALSDWQYSINRALYKEGDFAPYTEVVGTVLPIEDAHVKLDAVLLEDNRLTLNFLVELPEGEELYDLGISRIRVNGQSLGVSGASGVRGQLEGTETIWFLTETLFYEKGRVPLDETVEVDCRISGVYSNPRGDHLAQKIAREEAVQFAFTASGEKLKEASRTVVTDVAIPSLTEEAYHIESVVLNPFSQRVRLFVPMEKGNETAVNYELRGTDNRGNAVVFSLRQSSREGERRFIELDYDEPMSDTHGTYGSAISGSDFATHAEGMTLRLYARQMVSGEQPDPVPISEPFTLSWSSLL